LIKAKSVKDAVRNELFPTADMVVSMSKEFGVPFTTEDFEGMDHIIKLYQNECEKCCQTVVFLK
jgi:protein-tyrosine-phosphatase